MVMNDKGNANDYSNRNRKINGKGNGIMFWGNGSDYGNGNGINYGKGNSIHKLSNGNSKER